MKLWIILFYYGWQCWQLPYTCYSSGDVVNLQQWAQRYPNFEMIEVYSPGSYRKLAHSGFRRHVIDFDFMDLFQAFRNSIDAKCYVNGAHGKRRGVRTPEENYKLYDELGLNPHGFSWHTAGKAIDVTCEGMTPEEVAAEAQAFIYQGMRFTGIGIYPATQTSKGWTHLDRRPWYGLGNAFWVR